MQNGSLADFWSNYGVTLGQPAGRSGDTPGRMVEDTTGESSAGQIQGEIETASTAVDEKLQDMVNRFVSRIEEKNWKDSGYYISDVYACNSPTRAARVAARLEERAKSFGRGFIGIFIHDDHVHTIHSCPYTSRSCRCQFKNFPEAKEDIRRLLRKPRAVESLQRRDWENITKYFCTSGRRATYFKIFGTVQRLPIEITNLSNSTVSSQDAGGSESSLENCNDPLELYARSEESDLPESPGPKRRRARRHKIVPGGPGGIGGATGVIIDLLSKTAVCPLTDIVYTSLYLENPIVATKRLDSKEVKDAIDTRAAVINTWKRENFVEFYNNPDTILIWSARFVDAFNQYYYDYPKSYKIASELLHYQCPDNLTEFVTDVVNTLECTTPKRNCLLIVSPPSAGKNFFFDAVRDYYLNAGQMHNPNKYNQFAYQDCHNRRIIIWNEPNYEPRETENLKMLFAGDNLSANVKCKPQANVKRTPIIVLSNHLPHFAQQSVFGDRVKVYYWKSALFLKGYDKKPRPDAVVDLLYDLLNKSS